jgi:type IV pilus assembly protein PilA
MKKTNNKGFSLIELIIVIAIMAILVAIIAPNLTKYLGKSKKNTDDKNKDEIEATLKTCITDFEMDNGDLIPKGKSFVCAWPAGTLTISGSDITTTNSATFKAIVGEAIEASKTKSKENSSQYAQATISRDASSGTYTIKVIFS